MILSKAQAALLAAGLTLASSVGIAGCNKVEAKIDKPPPPEVLVSTPTEGEITDFEDFTGRTDAKYTVEVRARVSGYLDKINFADGSDVKEGDELFLIDARPYKAAYDRAVAVEAQAEAKVKRLDADYRRKSNLYARGAISREEFDLAADEYAEGKAAVGVAVADRDLAKINLDFTKVTAPLAGRISRRMVDVGNLIKADETMLTTIVTLDPMYIYFDIDERTMLRLRRLIREGKIKSRTEAEVPVLAELADEEGFPHPGTIDFSENKVDPSTGTLRVRGVIANPTPRVLSPGMFIRVRLPIGKAHKSLMIAEQALGTDQGKKFVYVVGPDKTVKTRSVTIGPLQDGKRVIEKGLKPGETIVVSGTQRIRAGIKVNPRNADEVLTSAPPKDQPSEAEALARRRSGTPTPAGG